MNYLVELRTRAKLTQTEAAKLFGVSLRSYQDYETKADKANTVKYKYFISEYEKMLFVDEEHGLLDIDTIKTVCKKIFDKKDVTSCYLFGSYAKHKEKETSDVDLLIDTTITGASFYGLVEELREALHKKVDLLDLNQVMINKVLLQEILKDGIKIYG